MTPLQHPGLPPLRRLLHAARVLKSVENTDEPEDVPRWEAAKAEYDLALEIAESLETSGGIHWIDRYECAERLLELEAAAMDALESFSNKPRHGSGVWVDSRAEPGMFCDECGAPYPGPGWTRKDEQGVLVLVHACAAGEALESLRQVLKGRGRSIEVLRLAVPVAWRPVIEQLATWAGTSPAGVLEVALRRFARQEGFVLPSESLSRESLP